MAEENLTFWGHLDVLRGSLIRIIVVAVVFGMAAFALKEPLFDIVLAPSRDTFITYKLMHGEPFHIELVNVGLTEQFMIHVKAAFCFGILVASPYILYVLYRFIAPALYSREKHYAVRVVFGGYAMFIVGILVNYFIIFPLTVRFLGTYQVSTTIHNLLSLESYVDTLMTMSLIFGILFEIPIISWLLALFGLLKSKWMRQYWRQAFVVIVIIAAVITPTGDAFTLAIVSLPIWLLYEASILIVRVTEKGKAAKEIAEIEANKGEETTSETSTKRASTTRSPQPAAAATTDAQPAVEPASTTETAEEETAVEPESTAQADESAATTDEPAAPADPQPATETSNAETYVDEPPVTEVADEVENVDEAPNETPQPDDTEATEPTDADATNSPDAETDAPTGMMEQAYYPYDEYDTNTLYDVPAGDHPTDETEASTDETNATADEANASADETNAVADEEEAPAAEEEAPTDGQPSPEVPQDDSKNATATGSEPAQ